MMSRHAKHLDKLNFYFQNDPARWPLNLGRKLQKLEIFHRDAMKDLYEIVEMVRKKSII